MKRLMILSTFLLLLPFYFSSINCTDQEKIGAAIYDGEELHGTPIPFGLGQNHPNPFNGLTTIDFVIGIEMHVTMKVFTEDWLEVEKFFDGSVRPGGHSISFSAREDLPSGEYYYTMEGLGYTVVRKMMLLK